MEKKKYATPEMEVYVIKRTRLLAGSPFVPGEQGGSGTGGGQMPPGGGI